MSVFKDSKSVQSDKLNFIAEAFWKDFNDVIYCQQQKRFYQWTWSIYKPITLIDLLQLMRRRYPSIAEFPIKKRYEVIDNYKEFSAMDIKDFDVEDGLNFQNKYLSMKDFTAHEHDQKRFSTILLPYDYEPENGCPLFIKTINDIFMDDQHKIKILQEFFGYCLSRDMRYEKAMFFVGEGGCGKSVILDCLQYVLNPANVSYVSLRHFSDSVRMGSIENKLVNVCTEVPKKAEDYEENFKRIVTGEYIQINKKYIDPYDIKPFAKLIFAVNQWPHIDDQSTAFYRRMLILTFNKPIPEEQYNRDLKENLKKETAGILNWAIEGLKRLREQKGFYMTSEMKETIQEIKGLNNPLLEWSVEHIEIKEKSEIEKNDAYNKYSIWCRTNGYKPVGKIKFCVEIFKIFAHVTKKNHKQAHGERKYVWPNIAWVVNNPIKTEEQISWDE